MRWRAACSGPAIAAISLGLVGHAASANGSGRNARFASIGNGLAAAVMGGVGYFFSARAVFIVTAVLLIPALFALRAASPPREIDPERAHGAADRGAAGSRRRESGASAAQRPLLILAGCVALFHLANAAMLPLMGSVADDALSATGRPC